jgi:hypothetical protein
MSNNNSDPKRIVLTCPGGRRWGAEFEGRITRRDIAKLNRIISVEFAKHERRRSVAKVLQQQGIVKPTPTEEKTNVNENKDHKERDANG